MPDHKLYNTPLLKKIGIKENQNRLVLNSPEFIQSLLDRENFNYHRKAGPSVQYDLIWLFTNKISPLESGLKSLRELITLSGVIWVSWYKKSSGLFSELNEDIIRETALALDLVDIKVVSVDASWSALKLVIPIAKRK